jgi:hypothetical protein
MVTIDDVAKDQQNLKKPKIFTDVKKFKCAKPEMFKTLRKPKLLTNKNTEKSLYSLYRNKKVVSQRAGNIRGVLRGHKKGCKRREKEF